MALQIRRGVDGSGAGGRLTITPGTGELIYTTDTKRLYIGDGTTVGGNIISGGGLNNVVEDTTPQLGGDLDLNGYKIVTAGNGNIELDPAGTGDIILHGNLTIDNAGNITKTGQLNITPTGSTSFGNNTTLVDGNVYITRNSFGNNVFGTGFTYAQHHPAADGANFVFYRTRGTGLVPTAIANGDDIVDLNFVGFDGTNRVGGAVISAIIEGAVSLNVMPTKLQFQTNNGTALGIRAELSPTGVWKVNSVQNYSGSDLTLTATNIKMVGDVQVNARGILKLADSDSSNYVGFQAPTTVASNVTWTLPATDGTTGQVLSTNGSGTLAWATASGGGTSLGSRATVAGTSASLSNGAAGNIDITGFKGYILYKIQTSVASWVRLYTDAASRTADNGRLEGTDPVPGAGVIAEVITTGASTILISPGAFGFNNEGSPTTNIPVRVTNKSGITTDVTVTLVVVQLEA
jgi:hypothetical protein